MIHTLTLVIGVLSLCLCGVLGLVLTHDCISHSWLPAWCSEGLRKHIVTVFFIVPFMVAATTTLGANENKASKECRFYVFDAVNFAGRNDLLTLRCRCSLIGSPALWVLSDLNGNLSRFTVLDKATPHAVKDYPSYSPDNKQITFVSGEKDHRNIYVMHADGTNVRQLTRNYNENPQKIRDYITYVWNDLPSFSPDGKRIIFVRSQKKPLKPKYVGDPKPPVRWDIYEIEIASGKERRLTNYGFPAISSPYYLSDGKRFIFWAKIYSYDDETVVDTDEINVYGRKYKQNFIFIMDGVNNQLRPAFTNGYTSQWPVVGKDDLILFSSTTVGPDGKLWKGGISTNKRNALFFYKKGKIRRLMDGSSYNHTAAFSPDGLHIAYKDTIMNIDGTGLTEIQISGKELKAMMESWLKVTQ